MIDWIKVRWAEDSTKRSMWLVGTGVITIIYAIIQHEPSSAILGAGSTIYGALNAATPDK